MLAESVIRLELTQVELTQVELREVGFVSWVFKAEPAVSWSKSGALAQRGAAG